MVQDLLSYLIQKAAPCQRGPLFCEERSLSAEADSQTTDIRRQMTGVRLCFLSFRVERNEIEKSPRATQPAAIVRKGHPATLLSDSLKSPQIPLWYCVPPFPRKRVAQSRFLKPQISILKSQTSPIETFRPPSPLYRQRAGKAWRTFFHSPNARIPWKRGQRNRSHHVTSVSPVHRK